MVVTAGQNWRSKNFTVFYAIHNAGALFFFIMLCLHGMYNGKPYTFQWVLGPMALYAIDRGVRRMATSKVALELTSSNSVLKGPEVLKITVPKSFNYKAGQYAGTNNTSRLYLFWNTLSLTTFVGRFSCAEIKVPLLAKHEWHPFTIASAPHEAEMVFFVKAVGDWTRALYSAFEERVDGVSTRKLKILVRGPFGAPAQHVGGYERIVLISGGVGSTPFSSICRELHHYINQQQAPDLHSDAPPSMDVSPMTEKLEEKLNLTVNRKFSVRYGDPIVPTNDESTRDHLRSELLLMSDQMSPRPVKQSAFQRADVTDMLTQSEPILKASKFSSRVRPTPRFGGRKASMLTKPKKGAAEKQPKNVKNMIGMSFYKPDGGGDVALEDEFKDVGTSVSEADSTALIEEEFAMKTMKLDKEDVAVSLGQTVGETSDRVQRALVVLHSITFNLILFLILLTRLTIVGYAHIFKAFTFKMNDSVVSFTGAKWLIWADLVMGAVMTCVIVVTILLEFPRQGQIVEKNTGSLSDVFLLIPFSIAAVVLEILILLRQNGNVQSSLLAAMLLIFVLPITGVLLGVRLQRIVGSRIMLADATTDLAYTRMRAVDFIWTTPHAADDSWLLERLIPIANKTQLRLHRYITRETIEDGSDGMKHDDKALSTNFGYVHLTILSLSRAVYDATCAARLTSSLLPQASEMGRDLQGDCAAVTEHGQGRGVLLRAEADGQGCEDLADQGADAEQPARNVPRARERREHQVGAGGGERGSEQAPAPGELHSLCVSGGELWVKSRGGKK